MFILKSWKTLTLYDYIIEYTIDKCKSKVIKQDNEKKYRLLVASHRTRLQRYSYDSERLRHYDGVSDIRNGAADTREEFHIELLPEGEALGGEGRDGANGELREWGGGGGECHGVSVGQGGGLGK